MRLYFLVSTTGNNIVKVPSPVKGGDLMFFVKDFLKLLHYFSILQTSQ